MAAVRLAWDLTRPFGTPEFNEEPFLLGAYDQIASFRGGKAGRARTFKIGSVITTSRPSMRSKPFQLRHETSFSERAGQPHPTSRSVAHGSVRLSVTTDAEGKWRLATALAEENIELPLTSDIRRRGREDVLPDWQDVYFNLFPPRAAERFPPGWPLGDSQYEQVLELAEHAARLGSARRPYAFAPIRSRPERTYDPVKDSPDPEGQHIPMVLARVLSGIKAKESPLHDSLVAFGTASGLFGDIRVKRLGKEGDPFQLLLKTSGPWRNVIDVGYGVSQILPILVELFTSSPEQVLLIQQPEVHLHPRAQAELASLLLQSVLHRRLRVVVETHSDYFVDRLRVAVRDGTPPENVAILYFQHEGSSGTQVFPMSLDSQGNLLEVPYGYRSFFLDEERRFLGVT